MILFVLGQFRAPGDHGATGGIVSNYRLIESCARFVRVAVVSFDRKPPPSILPEGVSVFHRPELARGRLEHWTSFGRRLALSVADVESEMGSVTSVWTTTVSNAVQPVLRGSRPELVRVSVIRAYEDFPGRPDLAGQGRARRLLRHVVLDGWGPPAALCTHHTVTNSRFMKQKLRAIGFDNDISVVFPPLDLPCVEVSAKLRMRDSLGFVTRGPRKNLDFVLRLAMRLPDLRFDVFGLDESVPNSPINVRYHGWISDRSSMYSKADAWLVPSMWEEPFGRVAIEAMSQGKVVFASELGGLVEAVSDAGVLLPVNDLEAWVAAIGSWRLEEMDAPDPRSVRDHLARFLPASHDASVETLLERIRITHTDDGRGQRVHRPSSRGAGRWIERSGRH